jgi:hypothetical protein
MLKSPSMQGALLYMYIHGYFERDKELCLCFPRFSLIQTSLILCGECGLHQYVLVLRHRKSKYSAL